MRDNKTNCEISLSLIKSNISENLKSRNLDRFSQFLSTMRQSVNLNENENMIDFTPKPFSENEH